MSWYIIKDNTLGLPMHAPNFPAFSPVRPMLAWEDVEDAESYLELQRLINTELANPELDLEIAKLPSAAQWWIIIETKSGEPMKLEGHNITDPTAPILIWDNKQCAMRYAGEQVRLVKSLGGQLDLNVIPPSVAAIYHDHIKQP